ncbi:MAG: ZIP family metal transporter [Chitinophagaceae bacterium]|nr:ZIP family metal transporter [Chitinophagaceae bacterium]
MNYLIFLLLFIIALIGAFLPFYFKKINENALNWILAFSGSFLLGISLIHLLPESFHELGEKTGIFIFLGFFIQLFIQRFSHGIEHGHFHHHEGKNIPILPIVFGLSIHAFIEGIPLGFLYQNTQTLWTVFWGIAAHKLPEAITIGILLMMSVNTNKYIYLFIFALATPISGLLASYYGPKFDSISTVIIYIIPVVIGAFIHISTTVLIESGTKHHQLSITKSLAIILGAGCALLSLLFHMH